MEIRKIEKKLETNRRSVFLKNLSRECKSK